jgi:hypothetical protein
VRHNTVHHIRTIPGPPVTCRPRRLAPDRLEIAKAEFEAMLRDGTARRSEFLLLRSTHRTQEEQRLASLWRLQSSKRPDHPRPLPRPSDP